MTGFTVTPWEPTDEMISAGMVAAQLESVDKPFTWANAVRAAYTAMIEAAPSSSAKRSSEDKSRDAQ